MNFAPVAVIPVYNHPRTIGRMVEAVLAHGLRCIVVDDGSEAGCAKVLADLARTHDEKLTLIRMEQNQGKGGAMMAGMRVARRAGFTHVLQIDADGQHDPDDIPRFVAHARQRPEAVICGCPQYDESVPKARLMARYATHVWVWINTLSLEIKDSMCGFRVYPLARTVALIDAVSIGKRMDFDIEILVRLLWRGASIVNLPTAVRYPLDGVSHFRVWLDNLLITRMHARLFFGMLLRSPRLVWRKVAST